MDDYLISEVLRQSRTDGNATQQEMADRLGVSKKTIQNWEYGVGCPRLDQAVEWFNVLNIQPMPYILAIVHGLDPSSNITGNYDLAHALANVISELQTKDKQKLLYILQHNHGSSPSGVLDMVVAHLHTPLKDRLNVATLILNNYLFAKETESLVGGVFARPDTDYLHNCIKKATDSAVHGRSAYTNIKRKEESTDET